MATERPTQQRIIDNVTISIEGDVPFDVEHDDLKLIRAHIGWPGYGQVTLWIDRDQVLRVVTSLLSALSLPGVTPKEDLNRAMPDKPILKEGSRADGPVEAEPIEEMPF